MKPNSGEDWKLLQQYPFVDHLVVSHLDDGNWEEKKPQLTIRVQTLDGALLYRPIKATDPRAPISVLTSSDGENRLGSIKETLYGLGEGNEILNTIKGASTSEERGINPQNFYGKCVFEGDIDKYRLVVLISTIDWHKKLDYVDQANCFGEFLSREIEVTIYQMPEQGAFRLLQYARVEDHLVLSHQVLYIGVGVSNIQYSQKMYEIQGRLKELVDVFNRLIYQQGMYDMLAANDWQEMEGQFEAARVRSWKWVEQRKTLVRVENGPLAFFVEICQTDQTQIHFPFPYVEGTLPQIRGMLYALIQEWQDPERRKRFTVKP